MRYRIIEEKYPINYGYFDESSELPKGIEYSKPVILLEEKKSIFHKWKFVKQFNTIKEIEFYIYNQRVEKIKPKKQVIKIL